LGLHDLLAGAWGVVHFGSLPTDAMTSRSEAFHNIMQGGFNVLQACVNLGIRRVAHASSIMVYGDFRKHRRLPVDENSPFAPDGVYASSKALLETLAADMCRWHDLSVAAFRLGRIVYEGSVDQRLRPYTQKREAASDVLWTYVDARDVASACVLWLESNIRGFRPFNIAADDVCIDAPTRELVHTFLPEVLDVRSSFDGQQCPYSSQSLKATLGWKAEYGWRSLCAS
jgi:nucleoside-diphosphate-sugar epimerase